MRHKLIIIAIACFFSTAPATLYKWDKSTFDGLEKNGSVTISSGRLSIASGASVAIGKHILYNAFELDVDAYITSAASFVVRVGYDEFVFNKSTNLLTNRLNWNTSTFTANPLSVDISSYFQPSQTSSVKICSDGKTLSIAVNSNLLYSAPFDRDTIGQVSVYSINAQLYVSKLELRGTIRDVYDRTTVFTSGAEGYSYFRIPAIIRTSNGTILAFAEGRQDGINDNGNIDIVMKRSIDDGATWTALTVIHNNGNYNASNPCAVMDADSGRVHILYTTYQTWGIGQYTVYRRYSDDNGATWSAAYEVSGLPAEWTTCHPGPGHGVQMRSGQHAGRLVIPVWNTIGNTGQTRVMNSSLIYSDDGGATWTAGPNVLTKSDECMISAIDEKLYMVLRASSQTNSGVKWAAVSVDGGSTWSAASPTVISSTVCQASTLYDSAYNVLFVSYPGCGAYAGGMPARAGLTIAASIDKGNSWEMRQIVTPALSAYSDMAKISQGQIGVLYETENYQYICLSKITYNCCMAFRYPSSKMN